MTEELIAWIARALAGVRFGRVIILVHEGRITRIDTEARVKVP